MDGGGERDEGDDGSRPSATAGRPKTDGAGSIGGGASASREQHVVRWESILPRRSLRVLLVEHDDSTRSVVTALLRKCGYRVAGVADGMKAWEVMKERRHGFDLVLTEVATPSMSGIGLLSKIMSTVECKNTPVVMMSTHDSVDVVLKCMLKGAVDFLVKPVRKNELRNLWQHVWRRHRSNRSINASHNNTASNQISANAGGRSKTGENSDEKSDAQSSGSKQDIEIESIQRKAECPQVNDRCTNEREANQEQSDKDMAVRESALKLDKDEKTREYEPVGTRVNATLPTQDAQDVSVANTSQKESGPSTMASDRVETLDPTSYSQNIAPNGSEQNMVVFDKPISNGQCSSAVLKKDAFVEVGETVKSSHLNYPSTIVTCPFWELSLRRDGCVQSELKEKHVLKHSVVSAFSRYGDKRIHMKFHKSVSSDFCTRTGELANKYYSPSSSHATDNEMNTLMSHTENNLSSPHGIEGGGATTRFFQASSDNNKDNSTLPSPSKENDCAGHSSTMEASTNHHPQFGYIPLPFPIGAIPYQNLCAGYGGIMQPIFYPESLLAAQSSSSLEKPSDHFVHLNNHLVNPSPSMEFHHHEQTGHHHRHWGQAKDISELGGSSELVRNPMELAYQSGSCSQDILKGSGSNGSGEYKDGVANTGTVLESGNESGVQISSRKSLDCHRSHREAALMKFRLKRKERCFEKKVRYYSRKKLAEQRPRIKGQFVRQKIPETTTTEEEN